MLRKAIKKKGTPRRLGDKMRCSFFGDGAGCHARDKINTSESRSATSIAVCAGCTPKTLFLFFDTQNQGVKEPAPPHPILFERYKRLSSHPLLLQNDGHRFCSRPNSVCLFVTTVLGLLELSKGHNNTAAKYHNNAAAEILSRNDSLRVFNQIE